MTYRHAMFVLLALAGACSDLPGRDDPRDPSHGGGVDAGVQDLGSCSGDYIACHDRSVAQCSGGCTRTTVCHSKVIDECTVITSPDACDSDRSCRWSSGRCQINTGFGCDFYESQTACDNDVLESCAWGLGCTGSPRSCFEIERRAECAASYGCAWMPR